MPTMLTNFRVILLVFFTYQIMIAFENIFVGFDRFMSINLYTILCLRIDIWLFLHAFCMIFYNIFAYNAYFYATYKYKELYESSRR